MEKGSCGIMLVLVTREPMQVTGPASFQVYGLGSY